MGHPIQKIFALDQLLAVLERRLQYEAFDYDAAVPALKEVITALEHHLSIEEFEDLRGLRATHGFYQNRGAVIPEHHPAVVKEIEAAFQRGVEKGRRMETEERLEDEEQEGDVPR